MNIIDQAETEFKDEADALLALYEEFMEARDGNAKRIFKSFLYLTDKLGLKHQYNELLTIALSDLDLPDFTHLEDILY